MISCYVHHLQIVWSVSLRSLILLQVEAYAAKGMYRDAETALHRGGQRSPAFARSQEFGMLQRALDKQLTAAGEYAVLSP